MKLQFLKTLILGAALSISAVANAGLINIDHYDITNARLTDFGGWNHTYDGSTTPVNNTYYDYANGSGTLNDGTVGTGTQDTHLFDANVQSLITLHFANTVNISSFNLYSFTGGNLIPGNINDIFITHNATNYNLASVGFGGSSNGNTNAHESFDILNSALTGVQFDSLSFFINTSSLTGYTSNYSISEIEVFGNVVNSVPEPSTLAIFALGIMGLVSRRFAKK